jgi:hypothetical protein
MTIRNLSQGHISVIFGHEPHHIEILMRHLEKPNVTELRSNLPDIICVPSQPYIKGALMHFT